METYLSLLRGINIGGNNKISMLDLQKIYEDLGFQNIMTYIQSGNVIFNAIPDKNMVSRIESKITADLKLNITVIIRQLKQIKTTIEENPFVNETAEYPKKMCVLFLNQKPEIDKIDKLRSMNFESEKYLITDNEIYLYCENGFGRAKLNTNYFESKLDIRATARNWKTITKLYELLLNNKKTYK